MHQELKISKSILKLNGLFSYSKVHKAGLLGSENWSAVLTKNGGPDYTYLKQQYYPQFRDFISNMDTHKEPHIFYKLGNDKSTEINTSIKKNKPCNITGSPGLSFYIQKIEIYLFNTGNAIYSLDIQLINPTGDLQLFSSFMNKIRNFDVAIQCPLQQDYLLLEYIEFLLNEDMKVSESNRINILNNSSIENFSGSKFKIFQVVELENRKYPAKSLENFDSLLFELGTFSPIGSVGEENHIYSPSIQFFEETLQKNKVSVFKNWEALCLYDSFTMIGQNYLEEAYEVWEHTYFRIYIYNIFCKYYIYQMNSAEPDSRRLRIERQSFHSFLNHFDHDYISYNFLPNLIHQKVKNSLEIKEEITKLYIKIERMNVLIAERSTKNINALLIILAIIAILPTTLEGLDNYGNNSLEQSNLIFTLLKIFGVIAIAVYLNLYKRKI